MTWFAIPKDWCIGRCSVGHRDARHKAAEIALEAQAEIKQLKHALYRADDAARYLDLYRELDTQSKER